MDIKERYTPIPVGVNTTVAIAGNSVGGFLCLVSGTFTLKDGGGNTLVTAFPVTAGVYYPLPFYLGVGDGASFATAGGASGLLGV